MCKQYTYKMFKTRPSVCHDNEGIQNEYNEFYKQILVNKTKQGEY